MRKLTRRTFIQLGVSATVAASVLPAFAAKSKVKFKVGVTDWNLKLEDKVESIALAKSLGFDRVPVSIGKVTEEMLHRNYLKSDPLGQRWVADCIPIAKAMGVRVVLLPFFGKGALETTAEMDKVGDILKEVAPAAERSGVILGLEDTISARDNVRIMERSKSPAVLTYYDVGNSTKGGFNVVEEIRWLGGKRICEVHLKDNPHYLGEGTIDFKGVIDALADIGFDGWAQLETDCPVSVDADMRRNLKFVRELISARNSG